MAARVLACLCTADAGGLTAAQLVRRLQVSPASISKAIRDLQGHELISRERDARHRRDRYVIDDDVWYRASLASARMNAALADAAQQGAAILGATTPAGARLETTSKFLRHVGHAMAQAVEHWRQMSPRTER
jgi:DNA-binding transcriptional regulator GbsR (MarR family)